MKTLKFFSSLKDDRGLLKSIEILNFNLFKIKRIFIINFKKKKLRGNHAHKKCKQFIICTNGKIRVKCTKNNNKKEFILTPNIDGLYIKAKTWVILEPLQKNTEIICLCDMKYLKSDYITDYKKLNTYK